MQVINNKKCDNCNKYNTELIEYKRSFLYFFTIKINICQTCISKSFRSFIKRK